MERQLRSKEFWAGLTFVLVAISGYWFGKSLIVGTPSHMGPGFFPMVLSAVLGMIGVVVMIKGLMGKSEDVEEIHLRPFLVLAAFVSFAVLLPAGLVFAIPSMTLIGALARRERVRLLEVALLSAGLTIFAWLVFIRLLDMPIRLWGL